MAFATETYHIFNSVVIAGFVGLNVKTMIGGGQIDEQIKEYTGADAWGRDAMAAVALANE